VACSGDSLNKKERETIESVLESIEEYKKNAERLVEVIDDIVEKLREKKKRVLRRLEYMKQTERILKSRLKHHEYGEA